MPAFHPLTRRRIVSWALVAAIATLAAGCEEFVDMRAPDGGARHADGFAPDSASDDARPWTAPPDAGATGDASPGHDGFMSPPPADAGAPPPSDAGGPGGPDAATPTAGLCGTCATAADCGPGNLCLTNRTTGERLCGRACTSSASCPSGYTCASIATASGPVPQCVPTSGSCSATPPTDAGTPTPDAAVPPSDGGATGSMQAQMLDAINRARAVARTCTQPGMSGSFAAAAPLRWSPLLEMSATRHSRDMAAGNFINHTGSDGSTPFTRISATGYSYSTAGENIAVGQTSIDAVMRDWLSDYGHCANIMSPNYTEVGMALVMTSSGYRYYWTQDFGRPR